MRIPIITAAIAAALVSSSACAEEAARSQPLFEVTPFIGYMAGGSFEDTLDGSDRDVDAAKDWGLLFNVATDEERHYELLFAKQSTEVDGVLPLDMSVQYLQIGGTIDYPDAERVIPYFGLTVGGTRFSPGQNGLDDETEFSFSAGGGLRIPFSEHFGMRFDVRAFVTLLDTDSDLFCVSHADGAACRIRARSDTFIQYSAALGFTGRF